MTERKQYKLTHKQAFRVEVLEFQEQRLEAKMLELNELVQRINTWIIKGRVQDNLLHSFQKRRADTTARLHILRKEIDAVRFELNQILEKVRHKHQGDAQIAAHAAKKAARGDVPEEIQDEIPE